jgi:hypothetical protein
VDITLHGHGKLHDCPMQLDVRSGGLSWMMSVKCTPDGGAGRHGWPNGGAWRKPREGTWRALHLDIAGTCPWTSSTINDTPRSLSRLCFQSLVNHLPRGHTVSTS